MIVKEKNGEGNILDLRICDNLELMTEIKDNTIDLIYCDILYGTGRKFKDYQDLTPIRSEIESHYIPRIKEMHRILNPTGSIYLQMDTKINHWIRCIMDDIFGYRNFRNEISWNFVNVPNFTSKTFGRGHEVILYYTKGSTWTYNQLFTGVSKRKKQLIKSGYNTKILDGKRYIYVYDIDMCKRKNIDFSKYDIVKYIDASVGTKLNDLWEIPSLNGNGVIYDTQKPKALIERIIKASSNEGDLVADFYAGSFTTAEVCKDLKRNFIGCDINPNCLEKAKERGIFSFTDEPTKAD